MHVTFLALGSTGDILPYATLARAMQDAGFQPVFVTTQDYRPLLGRLGLTGCFIPGDARAIIARAGTSVRRLMLAFAGLSRAIPDALNLSAPWLQESVAIVNQLPAGLYGLDLAEKLAIPHIGAAVIPLTTTADFPMMAWPTAPSFLPGYNRLGYAIYERLTWLTMRQTINRWRAYRLGLPALSGSDYLQRLRRQPVLYGYSSLVVPRPADWPDNVHVTGYWFPEDTNWQAPQALIQFLDDGPAPVFIGFGSMPVKDPQAMMGLIVEAAVASGQRLVLQADWANIARDQLPADIYKLEYAPYDWLFPQMAAVIHHGGSGTTAAGLRAGVPGLVTPFTFDQHFWGRRLAELGVGLPPLPIGKLSAAKLADSMVKLATGDTLRAQAAELGRQIQTEDGIADAVQLITGYLNRT